ncbi:MAG: hypothetical protein ACU0C9_10950 [Paracoccaceae bacterium]
MSNQHRLRDKIAKLNATPTGTGADGRVLVEHSRFGFVVAFLQEIDETILARHLSFEIENGAVLGVEVANRRILRVRSLNSAGGFDGHLSLVNQPLSTENGPDTKALAALLGDFLTKAGAVLVRSNKFDRDVDAAEIGISAETLADELKVELYATAADSEEIAVNDFVTFCQNISDSWVSTDADGTVQSSGDAVDVDKLAALSGQDLAIMDDAIAKLANTPVQPRCVVLGADGKNDKSILYVGTKTLQIFFKLPDGRLPTVIARWHRRNDT